MNLGGSNAMGIGINIDGGAVVGEAQQFTLADQRADPRTPQDSQHIGGTGLAEGAEGPAGTPIVAGTAEADGTISTSGSATLTTLADGWKKV